MSFTQDGIRTQIGRREFVGLGLGAFVVASIPLARHRPVGVVRRTMPVMGTLAQFAVVHRDPQHAHAAIDAAIDELLWVERTMTRFTDTSDIGRANLLAASDGVIVTPETAYVTREALRWAAALGGRYDPAIGAVCKLWDVKNRHDPPAADRVAELADRRFDRSV
jgi:thiamine biosynthesis lipoprotein